MIVVIHMIASVSGQQIATYVTCATVGWLLMLLITRRLVLLLMLMVEVRDRCLLAHRANARVDHRK